MGLFRRIAWLGLVLASLTDASAEPQIASGSLRHFPWHTGQVIGVSLHGSSPTGFAIEAITGSRFSRVGIIAVEGGKVRVYHSAPPTPEHPVDGVQVVSLPAFLKEAGNIRGETEAAVLEAFPPLQPQEQAGLLRTMNQWVASHVGYNQEQVKNPYTKNSAELVHDAFAAVGRMGIGEPVPIVSLNELAFKGMIARHYYVDENSLKYQVMTPFSVVSSPGLRVLFSNLPLGRILSDSEILTAWRDMLNPGLVKLLAETASTNPAMPYPSHWRVFPKLEGPEPLLLPTLPDEEKAAIDRLIAGWKAAASGRDAYRTVPMFVSAVGKVAHRRYSDYLETALLPLLDDPHPAVRDAAAPLVAMSDDFDIFPRVARPALLAWMQSTQAAARNKLTWQPPGAVLAVIYYARFASESSPTPLLRIIGKNWYNALAQANLKFFRAWKASGALSKPELQPSWFRNTLDSLALFQSRETLDELVRLVANERMNGSAQAYALRSLVASQSLYAHTKLRELMSKADPKDPGRPQIPPERMSEIAQAVTALGESFRAKELIGQLTHRRELTNLPSGFGSKNVLLPRKAASRE